MFVKCAADCSGQSRSYVAWRHSVGCTQLEDVSGVREGVVQEQRLPEQAVGQAEIMEKPPQGLFPDGPGSGDGRRTLIEALEISGTGAQLDHDFAVFKHQGNPAGQHGVVEFASGQGALVGEVAELFRDVDGVGLKQLVQGREIPVRSGHAYFRPGSNSLQGQVVWTFLGFFRDGAKQAGQVPLRITAQRGVLPKTVRGVPQGYRRCWNVESRPVRWSHEVPGGVNETVQTDFKGFRVGGE